MSLQRTHSAPNTVAGLHTATHQQRQPLPRAKSHLHVQKQEERLFLKPLATGVPPLASAKSEREDPFNLLGFFPPSDEKESWRWLHDEAEEMEENGEELEEELSGNVETVEEVISREDKFGVLSLFASRNQVGPERVAEERLLSPYQMEDAGEWEAVYDRFCGRRRTASAEGACDTEAGFGVLFFPGSS